MKPSKNFIASLVLSGMSLVPLTEANASTTSQSQTPSIMEDVNTSNVFEYDSLGRIINLPIMSKSDQIENESGNGMYLAKDNNCGDFCAC